LKTRVKYISSIILFLTANPDLFLAARTSARSFRNPNTEKCAKAFTPSDTGQNVRIVFYNTENLYDPYNDSTKNDDDFTSTGSKHWNYGRFSTKLAHIAKMLLAIGEQRLPAIVGLCEVENRYVLNKLVHESPLKKFSYHIIQYDSPDLRGIDVAVLYRTEGFLPVSSRPVRIRFPADTNLHTRDILYIKGILFRKDTLHLFVNHWPSKLGGSAESEKRRRVVAETLRYSVDSIFEKNPEAKILIMGDFNEEPDQPGIRDILHAEDLPADLLPHHLIDLMYPFLKEWKTGTHKYKGKWSVIDQFIVSGSLLDDSHGLHISPEDVHIFHSDFLLETESSIPGSRPARTYSGPRYTGGFSDHLPIYLDIEER
jgi:hypothetical protein